MSQDNARAFLMAALQREIIEHPKLRTQMTAEQLPT
jgi:hypothetical protein